MGGKQKLFLLGVCETVFGISTRVCIMLYEHRIPTIGKNAKFNSYLYSCFYSVLLIQPLYNDICYQTFVSEIREGPYTPSSPMIPP